MRFEGVVWRYVPANATPFHIHYLIHAAGRWNRRGVYGCLYTALAPAGAVAEFRKHRVRRGLDFPCDLVSFAVTVEHVFDLAEAVGFPHTVQTAAAELPGSGVVWQPPGIADQQVTLGQRLGTILLSHLIGNSAADLDACRGLADRVRENGYLAIHAPSAAEAGSTILAIYPENRPGELSYGPEVLHRFALNHGPEPVADNRGHLLRSLA